MLPVETDGNLIKDLHCRLRELKRYWPMPARISNAVSLVKNSKPKELFTNFSNMWMGSGSKQYVLKP